MVYLANKGNRMALWESFATSGAKLNSFEPGNIMHVGIKQTTVPYCKHNLKKLYVIKPEESCEKNSRLLASKSFIEP